jgi:hypothetical protein
MLKQPEPTLHKTTHTEITSLFGQTKLILDETPKAISPFGGLASFISFLGQIGFARQMQEHSPFAEPISNNAIPLVAQWQHRGGPGVVLFLQVALALLSEGMWVRTVRADSRFFDGAFLDFLEERGLPYVVERLTSTFKRKCAGIKDWTPIDEHQAAGEFTLKILRWSKERRNGALCWCASASGRTRQQWDASS